jgi:hypothetical protein
MGILDEAIREHLELKRQHGADDSELKQLEDDAFGPPQRPGAGQDLSDTASEAATEFMAQPDLGGEDGQIEQQPERSSTRREPIADVQEAPERVEREDDDGELEGEVVEGPEAEEQEDDEPSEHDDEPAEEEQPAGEHQAVSMPPVSHTTEERHAIADQPTEMFDVEQEFAAPEPVEPSDDELVAEEIVEPRLGPAEPIADLDPEDGDLDGEDEEDASAEAHEEDEDDFFDEQRLSDELDQALEAPAEPDSEEMEYEDDVEYEGDEEEPEADSEEVEQPVAHDRDEDVLEDTPDFLEEAPEDDQLWFEQKPPKDFDFDD